MERLLFSVPATEASVTVVAGGTYKRELLSPQQSTAQATLAASAVHPGG